ncbi:MAG: C39 family peptidase [Clostridiales bacterium]|nr:C39 family peptidase [Clostridiales bacterium]
MNQLLKKTGILFVIFAAALLIFFFWNRNVAEQNEKTYVALADASLPVVRVEMAGRAMNRMPGYTQEMENTAAAELLTILPQDRALTLLIEDDDAPVMAICYEVRSLDRERLVERTSLESWDETEEGIRAVLPIQNLISKEREYLLRVELVTQRQPSVLYYTRILWTDNDHVPALLDMAEDFSAKTFDYDQAKSLTTYMEPDSSEDNSSFGRTTIHSSFDHLTWGDLDMQRMTEVELQLKALDGTMSCVTLCYQAGVQNEEDGTEKHYEVNESLTMRWSEVRIYLMDYEREVNEIFEGDANDFAGKRIMLGITNDDRVEVKRSTNGRIFAWRVNRDLWTFDSAGRRAVKVFSFRGETASDVRNSDARHDVKILSVDDDGDLDFLVYGYMNRGNHEGSMGITGFHYSGSGNTLDELFFIPYTGAYETLENDLGQLTYRNEIGILYLYLDCVVYSVDLRSRENMVVADCLAEGSFAVSAEGRRIAWQEGGSLYEAECLYRMDLETGETQTIRGEAGEHVRVLGFVGEDLVYGIAREEDRYVINGRLRGLPMYCVRIINDQMQEETSYEKDGYYVSSVEVEESRIHLNRVTRASGQKYAEAQSDTIVCNIEMGAGRLADIGWYVSQNEGKQYFVQLENDAGRVHVLVSKEISYDQADLLSLTANRELSGMWFYARGAGRIQKATMDLAEAIGLAYEQMGYVTDANGEVLWSRVNRSTARTIRDAQTVFAAVERGLADFTGSGEYDEMLFLDAYGCSLTQVLYYIDRGLPVIGYTGDGSYLVLTGYDAYNVTVYDPLSGQTWRLGLNDSTEFFRGRGNEFICTLNWGN